MNKKILFLTLLYMIISNSPTHASTFQTSYCRNDDRVCLNAAFVQKKQHYINRDFNSLMDDMDLASNSYVDRFSEQITHLLNSEGLSFSDLQLSLNALRAINIKRKSILLKMLENDLLRIKMAIEIAKYPASNQFIFIFKKTISAEAAEQLSTTVLKVPFYILSEKTIPILSNTRDFGRIPKKPVLSKTQVTLKMPKDRDVLVQEKEGRFSF